MSLRNIPVLAGAAAFCLTHALHAAPAVDLTGEWRFLLDRDDRQIQTTAQDWKFPDRIRLPGMLSAQGFGDKPAMDSDWTGPGWLNRKLFQEWQNTENFRTPFLLMPPKLYVGAAWYQRDFDWPGGHAVLHLERVHWQSKVWLNGNEIGASDSLGTPHEFNLGDLPAGKHTLTLRIDNRLDPVHVGIYAHSVTDHTQGNWNGVVGRMEIQGVSANRITSVQVHPKADGSFKVLVDGRVQRETREAGIRIEITSSDARDQASFVRWQAVEIDDAGNFRAEISGKVANARLWDEYSPSLYEAKACLCTGKGTEHAQTATFGFREVGTRDGRITLNGRDIFLRGTLECAIFPLTGHPPTEVEPWKRIIRICKAHGLNHIRFHSWCPPQAAFIAADELGFYYQVEASAWPFHKASVGSGLPLDDWLEAESRRMFQHYGNHPSFLLMAHGNEPGGENHKEWLQGWVQRRKADDPRRLYTTAAGWPYMPGSDFHNLPQPRIQRWAEGMKSIINSQPPRTDFDWTQYVNEYADAPVVSHEIGQWCVYPDYKGIAKYTGYFKARNLEIFQETAGRNGLLEQAQDFLMASGKLQVLAYKHDIEAALRTPKFGGFQLLDLHDFPGQGTAPVGVLDAFWDEKGYVTPEEFRRFSGPIVPLARMEKMVYQNNESIAASLQLAHFGPDDLAAAAPYWKLSTPDGAVIAEAKLAARDLTAARLHDLASIKIPLGSINRASKLILHVGIAGTEIMNHWDVFVFPAAVAAPAADAWSTDLADVKQRLAKGEQVLWIPGSDHVRDDPGRKLVSGFSPIFWNTAYTSWSPPHTLGILCDPRHPALADFPTDFHSNWQWWEIQHRARPFILTKHKALKPTVQLIDDWFTNRKLGYVFEARVGAGRLLATSLNLHQAGPDKPAAAALLRSLVRHVKSDDFKPLDEMRPEDLDELIMP